MAGSPVLVGATIGFPLGMASSSAKIKEAEVAVTEGAQEIDMVINVGMLKAKENTYVKNEIQGIREAMQAINKEATLKVIL